MSSGYSFCRVKIGGLILGFEPKLTLFFIFYFVGIATTAEL
jgi:hypothetical protein